MTLRFYNTRSKSLEDFSPLDAEKVRIYSCGPTVYDYAHIGNLRAFTFADILKRSLKYAGYSVLHVMNFTDIDDKTIRRAKAEGRPLKEVTTFYGEEFIKDCHSINIEPPDHIPCATDEIESMVQLIEKLLEKGHAYRTARGDIYFRISTNPGYGAIAGLSAVSLKENADGRITRSDEYDKEQANDFALWKAHDSDDGDVFWETRIGKGRPGWHIECSAMSVKYLGQPFDIHTGGIDLLFPHHTNEIAQSECGYGGEFVKLWMHNEHLIVNGKKMSKSLGNFFTLRDLQAKGYDPRAVRFELLKTHYRQQMDFREDHLLENLTIIRRFEDLLEALDEPATGDDTQSMRVITENAEKRFRDALADDLNISVALAAVYEVVTEANKALKTMSFEAQEVTRAFLLSVNTVLGVISKREAVAVPNQVLTLLSERDAARKAKDFKRSDEIRAAIQALGFVIVDTPIGAKVKKG